MKQRLADLASIAEIIGAIAVVISLIYVGIQVNDANSAVRSAAANDANVAVQSWYLQIGSDPENSRFYYGALMSEEALPNEREFQFLMMTHALYLGLQNGFLLAEKGTIDPELRRALGTAVYGIKL
jgi:hypothetical protein